MSEHPKADSRAKRRLCAGLVAVGLGGALLIGLIQHYLPDLVAWITAEPAQMPARLRLVFGMLGVALFLSMAGMAAYLWKFGSAIVREQRFPPAGTLVVRDIPVLQGPAAVARGRLMQGFAVVLGLMGCAMMLLLWQLATLLGEP